MAEKKSKPKSKTSKKKPKAAIDAAVDSMIAPTPPPPREDPRDLAEIAAPPLSPSHPTAIIYNPGPARNIGEHKIDAGVSHVGRDLADLVCGPERAPTGLGTAAGVVRLHDEDSPRKDQNDRLVADADERYARFAAKHANNVSNSSKLNHR